MKFTLIGYYGYKNLGDELILRQILLDLQSLYPNCMCYVITKDVHFTKSVHPNSIPVYRYDLSAVKNAILESNAVILGGGGLIQDYWGLHIEQFFNLDSENATHYAIYPFIAKFLGKPVFYWSQGIGPLRTEEGRIFAKMFFSLADAGTVRDEQSYNLLNELKPISKNSFYKDIDPVLAPQPLKVTKTTKQQNRHLLEIGINIRTLPTGEYPANTINTIISFLYHLTENHKLIVHLLPFDFIYDLDLIRHIGDAIEQQVSNTQINIISEFDFAKVINSISQCDIFIGMRLHALILAYKLGVPTFGISYDPKVDSFCQLVNINCANDQSLTLENLLSWHNTLPHIQQQYIQMKYKTPSLFAKFLKNYKPKFLFDCDRCSGILKNIINTIRKHI